MYESIDTQIFLAYCEYKLWEQERDVIEEAYFVSFAVFREATLNCLEMIDVWLHRSNPENW